MYSDGPRAQPSIEHASSNVPGEDQGQPDHAPYPTSAEFQAQPPQGGLDPNTYEQTQGHPGYGPYLGFTGYQTQLTNQNAAFNMPGQSTLELGVHSHPTYGSISQEPSQHIIGHPMHNSASAIYSQHQPSHFSQSIQPSNETMPFNDVFDMDPNGYILSNTFATPHSHTPDVPSTVPPPPPDNSIPRLQDSTTQITVPLFIWPGQQQNDATATMSQSMMPYLSQAQPEQVQPEQAQPEQAQPATTIFAAQEQQTGHAAPSTSENESLHGEEGSWRRNASRVWTSFAGLGTNLMPWLEGPELTEEKRYQFYYFIKPALEAMEKVLNETVAERSS